MGSGASTYVNNYSGAQGVGNMRYNTSTQNMEVWDGNGWIILNTSIPMLGLTSEAEEILDWAREKRREEEAMLPLPSDHPAIRIAKENLNRAKAEVMRAEEQLKATIILSRDEQPSS